MLVVCGLERLAAVKLRGVAVGLALCAILAGGVAMGAVREVGRDSARHERHGMTEFARRRAQVEEKLRVAPGKDLVIVQYGPGHDLHREWVFNGADIDASDVVWARSMGAAKDAELLAHFAGRTVWLLRQGFDDGTDGLLPNDAHVVD
jgi:hypothetical protein